MIDPEVIERSIRYFKVGGSENLRSLIHLLLKSIGYSIEVGNLIEIPWDGIWHPKYGLYTDVSVYLNKYKYSSNPLVGILFCRSDWLYNRLEFIEYLVKALEDQGIGVIPVFTYGFKDVKLNTPSCEESISKYFTLGGRVLIEFLINLTSFFLLDHGRGSIRSRFKSVSGLELLKKLNIPIMQLIRSYHQSVSGWLENPNGVDYMTQVYQVIMPEVDGLIEPIYYAGSREVDGVRIHELESGLILGGRSLLIGG